MVILDTNAVLRYILQDNEVMADQVEEILSKEHCVIPLEVVTEMVYVMKSVYSIPRSEIAKTITDFLINENVFTMNDPVVFHGLETYVETSLDIADCFMTGYQHEGYSILTFDKKLQNRLRHEAGGI